MPQGESDIGLDPAQDPAPGLDSAADTWIHEPPTEESPRGAPTPQPPVARYELGPVLGIGAMGEVVRAWDRHLERHVAMKRLRAEHIGSAGVVRFIQEARVMGQLEHPGIVPVHDVGRDPDGRLYFTMEEVRGKRLDEVIADASTNLRVGTEAAERVQRRLVRVLVRVCEALAFAHDRGVVHRDIKPANVMVGAFGQVRVMDWGLALLREGSAPGAAAVAGTPAYMAPEQRLPDLGQVGPAADVYAIGAVLIECLSGQRPDPPAAPRTTVAAPERDPAGDPLPGELLAVAWRATRPEPAERYATMSALQADLQAWLENRPLPSLRYGRLALTQKWVRRHRAAAASATAVALAAAVLLTGGVVLHIDGIQAEAARAQVAELNARQRLAEAQVSSAHALAASGRQAEARFLYRQGRDALADMARSTLGARVGLWATHHLARSPLARLPTPPAALLAVDPLTDRVAALGDNGELLVRRLPTLEPVERWSVPGRAVAVQFQAGATEGGGLEAGEVVTWTREEGALVRRVPARGTREPLVDGLPEDARVLVGPGGRAILVVTGPPGQERGVLHGPRGRREVGRAEQASISAGHAVIGGERTPTVLWDLDSLSPVRQLCTHPCRGEVSPRGDAIVLYDELDNALWVEDLATGHRRWRQPAKNLHLARFTPDGEQVVAAGLEPSVDLLDARTGQVRSRLEGHSRGLVAIAVGGAFLVTLDRDDRALVWQRQGPPPPGELLELPRLSSMAAGLGGRVLLAAAGARLVALDVPTETDLGAWELPVGAIADASLAAGGSQAWIAAERDGLWALDLAQGVPTQVAALPAVAVEALPGGRAVVAMVDGRVGLVTSAGDLAWSDSNTLRSRPRAVAVDAGRDRLAVAGHGDRLVALWVASTGERLARYALDAQPIAVAFAPDGGRLAATDQAGHLHLWSLPDGATQVVALHDGPALAVAFSPGGGSVATGGYDWTVRFLDLDTLEQVYTERLHQAPVGEIAWSTKDLVLSGANDGRVLRRDLALDDAVLQARDALEGWESGRTPPRRLADALDLHGYARAAAAVRLVDPAGTGGWMALGRSQWRAGDLAGARDAFEQAREAGDAPAPYLDLLLSALDREGGALGARAATPHAP